MSDTVAPTFRPDAAMGKDALVRFATAFLFLLLGLGALFWNSARIASGAISDPRVLGGLHFLTLGFLSISIFAALRVFMGVALGTAGYGKRIGNGSFHAWALGAALFPSGLILNQPILIIAGAISLALGLTFFTIHLVPGLVMATRARLTQGYLGVALLSLWIALSLGFGAGFLRANAPLWPLPPGYFSAHVLVAVFGWVGATVAGVGMHLIPMFALSSTASAWPGKAALPVWMTIPIFALVGAFYPDPFLKLGWAAAGLGSALWATQVFLFLSSKLRKERDPGLSIAAAATGMLVLAWIFFLVRGSPQPFVGMLVIGWLVLFTLGIYHRVIPFLIWFGRFSRRTGRGPVPRVKDLTSEKLGFLTGVLAVSGVLIWVTGFAKGLSVFTFLGSGLLLASSLSTLAQLQFLLAAGPARAAPPSLLAKENV